MPVHVFCEELPWEFFNVASWVSLPILAMNLCMYSYLIDTCQEQAAWHRRELRISSEWVLNDSTIWNSLFLSLTSLISSKSVQFLYEQCLEPNCHGPGCNPCFFYWRFSDGASQISVMLWSIKRLLWMLSDSQSAFFSICFVHITSTHDYHVYNQLPDADSPRVLGTYPPRFDLSLFTVCTISFQTWV